jgi:hypothetical protein
MPSDEQGAGTMTKQTMHGPLHDLLTADHVAPPVPAAKHFDGHGVHRSAADALAASARSHARTERKEPES